MNDVARITTAFRHVLGLLLLMAVVLTTVGVGANEPGDEITVKGTTLKGHVVGFDEDGIHFRTIYGEGVLKIPYKDVQHLRTLDEYRIFYGEREEVQGRILGVEANRLLVGEDPTTAKQVSSDSISKGVPKVVYEESLITRLRARYPHWRGNLDLAFNFEEGAVDKRKIEWGFKLERRKTPTRYLVDFRQAFETQEKTGRPSTTTKDEFRTFLQGEYDLTKRFFLFARPAVERDEPRGIRIRTNPAAGVGYRVFETQKGLLGF